MRGVDPYGRLQLYSTDISRRHLANHSNIACPHGMSGAITNATSASVERLELQEERVAGESRLVGCYKYTRRTSVYGSRHIGQREWSSERRRPMAAHSAHRHMCMHGRKVCVLSSKQRQHRHQHHGLARSYRRRLCCQLCCRSHKSHSDEDRGKRTRTCAT